MRLKSPTSQSIAVSLLSGHAIQIPPDGVDVPEMFIQAAFSRGAVLAEDEAPTGEQPIGTERLAQLVVGIKTMLTEFPDDFTADGLPNRKKLAKLVGNSVTADEVEVAFAHVQHEATAEDDGSAGE